MHRFVGFLVVFVGVFASAPVLADGGLPELGRVPVGPFMAVLHNDSPTLVTGRNMLTVEVGSLPEHHALALGLVGPHGQQLEVPLRPLEFIDGVEEDHANHPDDHGTTQPDGGHDHHAPTIDHNLSGSLAGGPQTTTRGETYRARGSVVLPEAGTWEARLVVRQNGGESFIAERAFLAREGGPNNFYLMGSGALIGGFVLYGAIMRRHSSRISYTAR
jgi:hypothetical protein